MSTAIPTYYYQMIDRTECQWCKRVGQWRIIKGDRERVFLVCECGQRKVLI